jgi:hypothetical protein
MNMDKPFSLHLSLNMQACTVHQDLYEKLSLGWAQHHHKFKLKLVSLSPSRINYSFFPKDVYNLYDQGCV